MAFLIFFPVEPPWFVGSHGFWPILDRIRLAIPEACQALVEPLWAQAEAFQCIALDEVAPEVFHCFARAARAEFDRCSRSEAEAQLPLGYHQGIMLAWADLIRLLEADPRWADPEAFSPTLTAEPE